MSDTELLYVLCELYQKTNRYVKAVARKEEVRSWPLDMGGRAVNLVAADKALGHDKRMLDNALDESRKLLVKVKAVIPANVPATAGGRMD